MSRIDELRLVVRLACLTEDRAPDEHRALLRFAFDVDRAYNRNVVTNKAMWSDPGSLRAQPLRPLSCLYDEVEATYHPEGRRVQLPRVEREKIERAFAGWNAQIDKALAESGSS